MNLKNIGLIGLMGPRGSKKTTKMHGLEAVLTSANTKQNGGIKCIEMTAIRQWGLKKINAEFGIPSKHLSDEIMEKIFHDWLLKELPSFTETTTLILVGIPWGERQNSWLKHFGKWAIIHSDTSKEDSERAIVLDHMRKPIELRGKCRDAGEGEAKAHWTEYLQWALPGLQPLNGNVLKVEYSLPLHYQLEKILIFLRDHHASPLAKNRAIRAIGRLHNPSHPCHDFIRSIEAGKNALKLQPQN